MDSGVSRRAFLSQSAMFAASAAVMPLSVGAIEPIQRAGGPHLRVGSCAYSYRDYLQGKKAPHMTLEDFISRMAETGIDGVELTGYYFPDPLTGAYINKIVRHCFLLGLDISGSATRSTFTLPPGEARDREIAHVKQWIDYSADMGSPCLRVFAGNTPQGVSEAQAQKWVVECLEECSGRASEKGVMLALENHGGVTATPEGVKAILSAVQSEWVGLKLDTGNFHTKDPYADLAQVASYAISVHVKTETHYNRESKPADLKRIVKLLTEVNYRGYLNLEYEAAEDPLTAVPRTLRELIRLTS
jgi:sugar phosphate isomerase/epimerase